MQFAGECFDHPPCKVPNVFGQNGNVADLTKTKPLGQICLNGF
jgi:hypothetical protein